MPGRWAARYSVNGLSTTAGDSRSAAALRARTVDLLQMAPTRSWLRVIPRPPGHPFAGQDFQHRSRRARIPTAHEAWARSVDSRSCEPWPIRCAQKKKTAGSGTFGGSSTILGLTFDKDGRLSNSTGPVRGKAAKGKVDDVLSRFWGHWHGRFPKPPTQLGTALRIRPRAFWKTTLSTIQEQKTAQDKLLESEQRRIGRVRSHNLRELRAVSDALIASLEQQALSYFTNMFTAMRNANNS